VNLEKLLEKSEAYDKLLNALRSCSGETKEEVVAELKKQNGSVKL
jgi:hypothetical protein